MQDGLANVLGVVRTIGQILTAGIAITAFSLLLYSFAFNLRDRVARSFATILVCVVIIFTAEAIGSVTSSLGGGVIWPRIQWIGISFLPAVYLHFSDALLETTGRPSRWRRRIAVRLVYLASFVFIFTLPFYWLTGPVTNETGVAPHLQPTILTDGFVIFYIVIMVLSWINFSRAYRYTTTSTSRRRMAYLITGAIAPAVGAFPFLPYSQNFASDHQLLFWSAVVLTNLVVGVLLVGMAYAVAFFGVSWPDRLVKARLFKWLMRGPATASITLAVVTLLRRTTSALGVSADALLPIAMVATILICEYLITILAPIGERWFFFGDDRDELTALKQLEEQLVTRNDLRQFLEMVLAAMLDRTQAKGAYVVAFEMDGPELVINQGTTRFSDSSLADELDDLEIRNIFENNQEKEVVFWGDDFLMPLYNGSEEQTDFIGLLGISGASKQGFEEEQRSAMDILAKRAALALRDRRVQLQIFDRLEAISSQVGLLEKLRGAGRFNQENLLSSDEVLPVDRDLPSQVKEALTHYWGGPKLTNSPLMKFKIVRDALDEYDGNEANALRGILRSAIEQVKPEGDRRFTGEWILYNILEMKFMEGKKVREIAMRLAMSEADLYRKQRVAIESVAKVIADMEADARISEQRRIH